MCIERQASQGQYFTSSPYLYAQTFATMMRQRIPRWPRLHQHEEQEQKNPHLVDLNDDNDDDCRSDEAYCNRRKQNIAPVPDATRKPPLPFSFRSRIPKSTWGPQNIQIRVEDVAASPSDHVEDDATDAIPKTLELSDNEESSSSDDGDDHDDAHEDDDGTTVEDDDYTEYTFQTIATEEGSTMVATQESLFKNEEARNTEKGDYRSAPLSIAEKMIHSCMSTTSVGKELMDTYMDARDAIHQIIHAFTLGEGDITCVCGRLDDAKTEYSTLTGAIGTEV